MEIQNLMPVDYSNQRVMTTKQVAEVFTHRDEETGKIIKAVTPQQVQQNFANNRNYFIKGVHYFKIEGDVLENLRVTFSHLQISPMTRVLYLWTEWGAMLHAKMLNTDTAWKKYQALLQFYFHCRDAVVAPVAVPPRYEMPKVSPCFKGNYVLTDEEKRIFEWNAFKDKIFFGWDTLSRPCAPEIACVYALEMSNNTVKIGVTGKIEKRPDEVANATLLDVLNIHSTGFAPRPLMFEIERKCHAAFANKRARNEFFAITFEEACAELDSHADEIAAALKRADEWFLKEVDYFYNVIVPTMSNAKPVVAQPAPLPVDMQAIQDAFLEVINDTVRDAVNNAVKTTIRDAVNDAVRKNISVLLKKF